MTDKSKNTFLGVIYSIVGGVVVGVLMFILQGSYTDGKELRKEVIRLDKVKAETTYVDERCETLRTEIQNDRNSVDAKLESLNKKTDRILELMIKQNR